MSGLPFVSLIAFVCAAGASSSPGSHSANPGKLVEVGKDGKLVYQPWNKHGDRIPDFSNCGYMGGGVAIPDVPVRVSIAPIDGDNTQHIQAAIDKVAAMPLDARGFRGAVLLTRGVYRVCETLRISATGVVLRGEGDGEDGTVLLGTGTKQYSVIAIDGGGKPAEIAGTRHKIADAYVPVGSRTVVLESTDGLAVGDDVIVACNLDAEWIRFLGMDKLNRGPDDPVRNWSPLSLTFQRVITAIKGNTVTVDAPVVNAIDARWGGGEVYKYTWPKRIRQVGVERLRGDSQYKDKDDEKHAWDFIQINALRDGWVRNVTSVHMGYSCVNVHPKARSLTIQDCCCLDPVSQITGGRRYSFALAGQLTLVQRCHARNGRHDFVMHARVPGPNVFLNCTATKTHADSGPHHRWSTGTLYDNVTCGPLNVENRGRSGTGHGWAGAQMVFWNCKASSITSVRPPTSENFVIGCAADKKAGDGYWESFGRAVTPKSLYLAQLEERLGTDALKAISEWPGQRPPTGKGKTSIQE